MLSWEWLLSSSPRRRPGPNFGQLTRRNLDPGLRRDDKLHPQVQLVHKLVVGELVARSAFVLDPAVDDHVAAVGDPDRLVEVLLGHEHREPLAILELADLVDGADDQDWP